MSIRFRYILFAMVVVAGLCVALYANFGTAKPPTAWKWMDIVGEGGTSLLAAAWTLIIVGSRPAGRVTLLLAGGLGAIALGGWADLMDEFFTPPHADIWDNLLESLSSIAGMLALTVGLYFWRQEQFSLNEHMRKRERLFRDHRSFDRITQLANADYLRRQIRSEQARNPDCPCALILLDINQFHLVNRVYGHQEGNRLLQAVSHLILLNLRPDDLLCRYAGDRFAVLMPTTPQAVARKMADHLEQMVGLLSHHSRDGGERIPVTARIACAVADIEPDNLLAALDAALEPPSPATPGQLATV